MGAAQLAQPVLVPQLPLEQGWPLEQVSPSPRQVVPSQQRGETQPGQLVLVQVPEVQVPEVQGEPLVRHCPLSQQLGELQPAQVPPLPLQTPAWQVMPLEHC